MDEMIVQREESLFVGDLAAGQLNGQLAICPEQFPGVVHTNDKAAAVRKALLDTLPKGIHAIYSGHGWPYHGNWPETLNSFPGDVRRDR